MQVEKCRNDGNAVVMPENEKEEKKEHTCTGAYGFQESIAE